MGKIEKNPKRIIDDNRDYLSEFLETQNNLFLESGLSY